MSDQEPGQLFNFLLSYLQGKIDANQLRAIFSDGTQTRDAFAAYKNTCFTEDQKQQLKTELAIPHDAVIEDADNLLDLIEKLNKAGYGYGQLADFRYHLKKIHPEPDWTRALLFTTLSISAISAFFFLNKHQRNRLEQVLLLAVPFIAPLFLVGLHFSKILRQAYLTRYEDTYHSDHHRVRRWLVGTLPSIFNLSAYAAIAMMKSMSPLAAVLFISASVVAVLDGAFRLYHLKTVETQAEQNTASYIRQENRKSRTEQTLTVKLFSAIALSAVAAVACFFPPSLVVLLSCTALFILIPWTESSYLHKIHTNSSHELLTQLKRREDELTKSINTPQEQPRTELETRQRQDQLTNNTTLSQASNTALSQASFFRPVHDASNESAASLESSHQQTLN